MAGTGPEYEYPTTGKDETIPVVSNEDPVAEGGQGTEPVVGEDSDVMDDKAIAGIIFSLLVIVCIWILRGTLFFMYTLLECF